MSFELQKIYVEFSPILRTVQQFLSQSSNIELSQNDTTWVRSFTKFCIHVIKEKLRNKKVKTDLEAVCLLVNIIHENMPELINMYHKKEDASEEFIQDFKDEMSIDDKALCPICQYSECNAVLVCCNNGVHKECFKKYIAFDFHHCPLCLYQKRED